jgi:hypothetical protein
MARLDPTARLALALLLPCLGACAPYGRLYTSDGVERLQAAWFSRLDFHGVPSVVFLLANSQLECSLPDTDDPAALRDAQYEIVNAFTREGARIVGLQLLGHDTASWPGVYEITRPLALAALEGDRPRQAQALYLSVEEARAEEIDGLYRSYLVEDQEEVYGVPEPGTVTLETLDAETATGAFYFPAIDVSGNFRASACDPRSTVISKLYGEGYLGG